MTRWHRPSSALGYEKNKPVGKSCSRSLNASPNHSILYSISIRGKHGGLSPPRLDRSGECSLLPSWQVFSLLAPACACVHTLAFALSVTLYLFSLLLFVSPPPRRPPSPPTPHSHSFLPHKTYTTANNDKSLRPSLSFVRPSLSCPSLSSPTPHSSIQHITSKVCQPTRPGK